MLTLRDYQQDGINALFNYFTTEQGNPLVVMPTGSGKSVVIAATCEYILKTWGNQRIMLLTHVKELIEQNYEKFRMLVPHVNAGIYSASLKSRDTNNDVIFAGIQSVYKKGFDFGKIDIVIIDECHLVPQSNNGTYRKFLADLSIVNPYLKVIGFTATHYRLGSGLLTDGKHRIFTDVAYELPMKTLLEKGHLSTLTTPAVKQSIDLTDVKKSGGEFKKQDLEKAVQVDGFTENAIDEILHYGRDRQSWLIFCPTVAYSEEVCEQLLDNGVSAAVISGKTKKNLREKIIRQYKSGEVQAIVNCGVLTTGFDAPQTDMLVILRAMVSVALYVQIIGRGMRPAPGKENCLVLDYGRNIERHGPVDMIQVVSKTKRPGEAPSKICPECKTTVFASVRFCPECHFEFQFEEQEHETKASDAAILSHQKKPDWKEVKEVTYALHKKFGRNDSLKVTYRCSMTEFYDEWIHFEGVGKMHNQAVRWWRARDKFNQVIPLRTDQALNYINEKGLHEPSRILIERSGKYKTVANYVFGDQAGAG